MKMKKPILLVVAALCCTFLLRAQNPGESFGVYKVGVEELIRFIRTEISPDVY